MSKPIASLSLDLDNQWSYMKTHGDDGWAAYPSYLDTVTPRFLDILDEFNLKITVFIVGEDAAREKNHAALRMIPERGHEVGNHSFKHEPWLHLYRAEELKNEFFLAEKAIRIATRTMPIGFRGPGFSFSTEVLELLVKRGYQYDCSTFPTFLGPLARAYYFMTAKLNKKEQAERKQLFGKFSEGFRPLKPYRWGLSSGNLLEIPVTTMPIFKTPFHASYILYLACYSRPVALLYLKAALGLCRLFGVQPSMLLHPLDFLGAEDVPELGFFPAMHKSAEWKCETMRMILEVLAEGFDVKTMREHADLCRGDAPIHPLK